MNIRGLRRWQYYQTVDFDFVLQRAATGITTHLEHSSLSLVLQHKGYQNTWLLLGVGIGQGGAQWAKLGGQAM